MTLYHESPLEDAVDLEVGLAVELATAVPPGLAVSELPREYVATTQHRGPYEDLHHAYRELLEAVSQQGLKPGGPWRELYLVTPPDVLPEQYLTEVQLPVERA